MVDPWLNPAGDPWRHYSPAFSSGSNPCLSSFATHAAQGTSVPTGLCGRCLGTGTAGDRRTPQSYSMPFMSPIPQGPQMGFGPMPQQAPGVPSQGMAPQSQLGTSQNAGDYAGVAGNLLNRLDATTMNTSPRPVASAFDLFGKPANSSFAGSHHQAPATAQQQNELMLKALTAALSGDKKSLPSWSGGVESLRPWLRQLSYWELDNNVPKARWGIKLLQSFSENSAPRKIAETIDLSIVLSEAGYGAILAEIMAKYGPYLEAIGPAAIDQFFYGLERSRTESFSNYIASREIALQELEAQLGEKVPPRIAGRVLLRGANLTEQQRENLAIKYHALLTFDEVARALRPLDRPEALVNKVNKAFLMHREPEKETTAEVSPDENEEELVEDSEEDEPESDGEGNLTFLLFDQNREYTEEETQYIWAYNSAYRDVRKDLARKKGRNFSKPKETKNRGGAGRRAAGAPSTVPSLACVWSLIR